MARSMRLLMMLLVLCFLIGSVFGDGSLYVKIKNLQEAHHEKTKSLLESKEKEFQTIMTSLEASYKEKMKRLHDSHDEEVKSFRKSHEKEMKALLEDQETDLENELKQLQTEIEGSRPAIPQLYSCDDAKRANPSAKNGKFQLLWDKNDTEGYPAWCEFEEDGNHLTFLRRVDESVDFSNKRWGEYKDGFGAVKEKKNYWIGLDFLHKLTNRNQGKLPVLTIVMRDKQGTQKVARYTQFSIGNEEEKYKLKIGGFNGTVAGDAMAYSDNMSFSTIDRDNDDSPSGICTKIFKAAGWFRNCLEANLMGEYQTEWGQQHGRGLTWKYWNEKASMSMTNQLAFAEMRIGYIATPDVNHMFHSCAEMKKFNPNAPNGEYTLYFNKTDPTTKFQGYCEFASDGSWLLLTRRVDATVDFYRGWEDYKRGFGQLDGNFWIGNELMHKLTNKYKAILKIVMRGVAVPSKNITAQTKFAQYTTFRVGSEEEKFRLVIGGFRGDVGGNSMYTHNGMAFSTKDRDNDNDSGSCSTMWKAAWWYNRCVQCQLTGEYFTPGWDSTKSYRGIWWWYWGEGAGHYWYKLAYAEMKIKF